MRRLSEREDDGAKSLSWVRMQLSSFADSGAVAKAVRVVADGGVLGAHFGTVFGLIVDGRHAGVADEIMRIKGAARGHKPLGACLRPSRIVGVIDRYQLPPRVRELVMAPWFSRRLAAMVAVRAPASSNAGIPPALRSHVDGRDWVQVFDPMRMPGASTLIAAMWDAGLRWVAATSMNESGSTEIVETDDAVAFAERHGLSMLFEPAAVHAASGSLPILELRPDGLRLDRHGIIAVADLEAAIGEPIPSDAAAPAHYPPMTVPPGLLDDRTPAEATQLLLELLYPH